MSRRVMFGLLIGLAALCGTAWAQQDFSNVEIKTTHVAGSVYLLEGRGGNIGVSIGDDGVLMIDDQFAPLAERIQAAIRKLGGDKPAFILNTHWHGDHVGGNAIFGRDGTIIAHANVYQRLSTKQEFFGRTTEPQPRAGLPVITFEDSLAVHFNGEEIRVIHYPHGHTDGDSVVFFRGSNVVHMGDDMFMGMFPFVDLEHGGDVEGLARNVAKVIAELPEDVKVIPGHGPLSSLADLKTFHRMLVETTAVVRSGIAAGNTLKDIQSAGVPEIWKNWGGGFIKTDQWLETIHKSLSAH